MEIRKITYVVPCYNEDEVLGEFYRRVSVVAKEHGSYDFEFLFVNDGSTDKTAELLNGLSDDDSRVKVLHFARNRGHQVAITAGMDYAEGDVIVVIDADLQDPPELLGEMLEKIKDGCDVVHAQRRKRRGETSFKLGTAWLFYKIMNAFSKSPVVEHSGDFRAFTRPVLRVVRRFREPHRFMRGIFSMVGFRQCTVQYDRDVRHAGTTKYPVGKMFRLAVDALLSFSSGPIKLIIWVSLLLWCTSLIYLVKALLDHFVFKVTVPGWTSLIILLTFFAGIQVFCLGIIGSYIGRIFEQGQHRPLYWLADTRNVGQLPPDERPD